MKTVTIEFTRKEALQLNLLVCKCGHPINNHFTFDNKVVECARCSCKKYDEIANYGSLVENRIYV